MHVCRTQTFWWNGLCVPSRYLSYISSHIGRRISISIRLHVVVISLLKKNHYISSSFIQFLQVTSAPLLWFSANSVLVVIWMHHKYLYLYRIHLIPFTETTSKSLKNTYFELCLHTWIDQCWEVSRWRWDFNYKYRAH